MCAKVLSWGGQLTLHACAQTTMYCRPGTRTLSRCWPAATLGIHPLPAGQPLPSPSAVAGWERPPLAASLAGKHATLPCCTYMYDPINLALARRWLASASPSRRRRLASTFASTLSGCAHVTLASSRRWLDTALAARTALASGPLPCHRVHSKTAQAFLGVRSLFLALSHRSRMPLARASGSTIRANSDLDCC